MKTRIVAAAIAGSLAFAAPGAGSHEPAKCKAAKAALKKAKKSKNRAAITRAEFQVFRYCDF